MESILEGISGVVRNCEGPPYRDGGGSAGPASESLQEGTRGVLAVGWGMGFDRRAACVKGASAGVVVGTSIDEACRWMLQARARVILARSVVLRGRAASPG